MHIIRQNIKDDFLVLGIMQLCDLCAVLCRVSECARLGQKPAADSEENVTRIQELCEIRGKR